MSFFLVVISIALVAVRGLNLGVDFAGGQSVHVEFTGEMPEIGDIREEVGKIGLGEATIRSEEHTSELQSLMRISYAVFCLQKKNNTTKPHIRLDKTL